MRLSRGALVWVTRTAPAAETTAERVRELGYDALVRPLLEVQPASGARIDLTDICAIAFTSANAVTAFGSLSPERELRVFAVGDATARAAREIGFETVLSAEGDVATLAAALTGRRRELKGPILHPTAAEPAQDLGALIAPAGLEVRKTVVYETVEARPAASLIARLPEIGAALIHSARAARALAALLAEHPARHMQVFAISAQAARPLEASALAGLHVAPAPSERALLSLLS